MTTEYGTSNIIWVISPPPTPSLNLVFGKSGLSLMCLGFAIDINKIIAIEVNCAI